ncbi:MAG: methyl-accepting chemotaxis protein [Lachnospiraceae bacterium]
MEEKKESNAKKEKVKEKESKEKESKEKGFQSLRSKIMRGISIPVVLVFLIAGTLILWMAKTSVNKMSETELTVKSQAASYQVSEFFTTYLSEVEQVAANGTYEEFFRNAGSKRMEGTPECNEVIKYLAKSAQTDTENVLFVWIAGFENSQMIQSDGFITEDGWDVTSRPWYIVKETKEVFLTSPYEDASTGKLIITAAAPIIDEKTGEAIGASGIDITLEQLNKIMSKYTLGKKGSFLLADADSQIIYNKEESLQGKKVDEIGLSKNVIDAITKDKNEFMKYTRDNVANYGYVTNIENINWSVTSMLPATEYNATLIQLAVFIVVLFLVGIFIVVFMVRGIASAVVKPLKVLTGTAQEIAKGNLEIEVEVTSNDEIGKLGSAITDTVSRLKEYIKYIDEISKVLGRIAEGDLTFQLKEAYAGEFAVLKTGLLQIQQRLADTLKNMNQIAVQVEEGAKQISQVATALAESSGEQTESVEKLNQTVEQVNQMAGDTQENAQSAKLSVQNAGDALELGNGKMKELTDTIQQISESSQKISGIMAIIDEISDQTNLLSLNASIEAARAGEAGKGFAVVANEVGALAKQTAESSQKTRELITNVQDQIKQGEQVAQKASEMMLEVLKHAKTSRDSMEEITEAVKNETDAIGVLKKETEQITGAVESNMAVSEESVASSEELAVQATILRELVKGFKI